MMRVMMMRMMMCVHDDVGGDDCVLGYFWYQGNEMGKRLG